MAAPNLIPFLYRYDVANAYEKAKIASECLNYIINWIAETGSAALEYESQVINSLRTAKFPEGTIKAVQNAFNVLRRAAPAVQQAAQTARMTGPQLWQQVMGVARQTMVNAWGGAQNIGNGIMNGMQRGGTSFAQAFAAIMATAAYAGTQLGAAISKAIAAIGGIEVLIGALLVIALAMLAHEIYKRNRKPFQIEDPVLKRMQHSGPVLTRMQPGQV